MTDEQESPVYFTELAKGVFRANDPSRGPWSPDHCHAGPVTALVARALEQAIPDKMMTRITLDLVRATPMTDIAVTARIVHEGRTVTTGFAELRDAEGALCVAATSMHLARKDYDRMPTAPVTPLRFEDAEVGATPLPGGYHKLPVFGNFLEVALLPNQKEPLGPKTVWMRTLPLLRGESPSPIQSLCPLADCGNGLSRNASIREMNFMNTDLTIHIHREPQSDWLASTSISHWQKTGIGMSQAVISDTEGPVATALQSLVLRPAKRD